MTEAMAMQTENGKVRRGVTCGVLAGAFWGLVFVGPRWLADFMPFYTSAGRYLMYGTVSLIALLPSARRVLPRLTATDAAMLLKLAVAGNLLYYVLVNYAVNRVGIAPTSLIIGVLPVTVTLAGRRDRGAVPLRRLAWPLALVLAGLICINVDVFSHPGPAGELGAGWRDKLFGVGCATGALVAWTWFAVENARYLQRHGHFDGNQWSLLWGLASGLLGGLLWLALAALHVDPQLAPAAGGAAPDGRWQVFWLVCAVLAVGPSWLGNGLWNAASRLLPLTLSGQMIVFETLFALLYGFAFDARWPRPLETAAIVLLMAGVSWSVRCHADAAPLERSAEPAAH